MIRSTRIVALSFLLPALLGARSVDDSTLVPDLLDEAGTCTHGETNAQRLQEGIDAAIADRKELFLPAGRFCVASTLQVVGASGFRVTGRGAPLGSTTLGTELVWDGNDSDPMWDLQCRECYFGDFTIRASRSLAVGIVSRNSGQSPDPSFVPTALTFERIRMDGINGMLGYGWQFRAAPGNNQNNDNNLFLNCGVFNFSESAVQFINTQSKINRFVHFAAVGWDGARAGISTGASGAGGGGGGGFQVFGAAISTVDYALDLAGPNDTFEVFSLYVEDSGRLLETSGFSQGGTVTFVGGRFAQDALHSDDRIVKFLWGGHLTVRGMIFDSPPAKPEPREREWREGHIWSRSYEKQTITVEGNFFRTDAPALVVSEVVPGASPPRRTIGNNLQIDSNGTFADAGDFRVDPPFLRLTFDAEEARTVIAESNSFSHGPAVWAAARTSCREACEGMGMDRCAVALGVVGGAMDCSNPAPVPKFCACH